MNLLKPGALWTIKARSSPFCMLHPAFQVTTGIVSVDDDTYLSGFDEFFNNWLNEFYPTLVQLISTFHQVLQVQNVETKE